jgi:class 3 adenylate cyclase/predicted ATPase
MFCDLVGATALSEQFDPEDLRELLREYQAVCAAAISRFDGQIIQYLGDGLLVYFGYPRAHEDDAQRAVRAGLTIVEDMAGLTSRLERDRGVALAVRLGIHTGLVVAGEMGAAGWRETLAVGETPNVAARLQSLADANTVVISHATYRLTQGFFACQPMGAHPLRGISQPMELYRVLHETGARGRLDITAPAGLTSLVGREYEIGLLRECWTEVQTDRGRVVLLSGEAGIGKSRLVQVLKEHVAEAPHALLEFRCSPYHQNSALYPVIDSLQRRFQFRREDTPADKLRHLEEGLAPYDVALPEVVPLFAALLSVPLAAPYAPLGLPPQRQRQKTLEALLTVVQALVILQPVLFLVEDLHWADPSTLELLTLLIDQAPPAGLLTLLTFRPDFTPPWAARPHLTLLTLTRFERPEVEAIVQRVAGGKALPPDLLRQIVLKTDGIPLFIEELTKMLLESGALRAINGHYELAGPMSALTIPTTLHDSLMARLDRLSSIKEVAQLGATIGREFSYEVLRAVYPLDDPTLQEGLARLVEAELVYQRGAPPQATYLFKHALIQDAAYQSLLKSKRQQYHPQIARVLEERFPEIVETQPELLAHHYTAAGLKEQAIPYWQRAGQRAMQRSGNTEAIAHFSQALALLGALPETSDRIRQELTLQTALGAPMIATKSYGAPEVERIYARARELCDRVGETPQLIPTLFGLLGFYLVRGKLNAGRDLAEQIFALAARAEASSFPEAHFGLGMTLFYLGELTRGRSVLQRGIALHNPERHRTLVELYAFDPGAGCRRALGLALWLLGYPDQALQQSREAIRLEQARAHAYGLAGALAFGAVLHQHRREEEDVLERAEATIRISADLGFPYWTVWGRILRAWVRSERAQPPVDGRQRTESLAEIRETLAGYAASGAEVIVPYWLALLAEVARRTGQVEEGLSALTEAFVVVERTGERWWEAELHRLHGELSLARAGANEDAAEAAFRRALGIAREQSARSLELRAALSIGRLLGRRQGRRGEAREMVAQVYGWFTEGFDTTDLKEARAWLEVMS